MRVHEHLNPRIGKTGEVRTLPDVLPGGAATLTTIMTLVFTWSDR
jgi:hypothetical protein